MNFTASNAKTVSDRKCSNGFGLETSATAEQRLHYRRILISFSLSQSRKLDLCFLKQAISSSTRTYHSMRMDFVNSINHLRTSKNCLKRISKRRRESEKRKRKQENEWRWLANVPRVLVSHLLRIVSWNPLSCKKSLISNFNCMNTIYPSILETWEFDTLR